MDAENEVQILKRKHAYSLRELTRELSRELSRETHSANTNNKPSQKGLINLSPIDNNNHQHPTSLGDFQGENYTYFNEIRFEAWGNIQWSSRYVSFFIKII